MEIDGSKLITVKYLYELKLLVSDEVIFESDEKRGRITILEKQNNPIMDNMCLPFIKVLLSVDNDELYNIQENKDVLTMDLKIKTQQFQTNEEGVTENIGESILWEDIFQVFVQTESITVMKTEDKTLMENNTSMSARDNQFYDISLVLYSMKKLNIFKKKNAFIFNECNPITALTRMLNFYGFDDVICDIPDNEESFKQIIIPKGNIKDNIKYLQDTYGIFNTGVTFFMDVNRTYILKNNNTDYAVEDEDYNTVSVVLMEGLGSENTLGYYIDKDNGQYIMAQDKNITPQELKGVKKETFGNLIHVYNNKLAEKSLTYDASAESWEYTKPYKEFVNDLSNIDKSDDNVKIYENSLDNDAIVIESMEKALLTSSMLGKLLLNVDLGIVNFNKVYTLHFTYDENVNKLRKGSYRLIQSTQILSITKTSRMLTPMASVIFCKMK